MRSGLVGSGVFALRPIRSPISIWNSTDDTLIGR